LTIETAVTPVRVYVGLAPGYVGSEAANRRTVCARSCADVERQPGTQCLRSSGRGY
jgi:hypothetical protein